ncbi:Zinc finger CW-type PWWP domain protein 1 [Saguinus oedipus]|uniref:Zinc finger CW-type PWWP domain protein 1 n=1 Tax=Saguinus oedipus TaxID=9490 RepID=A0ABQ9W6C4_SAGOE|nr:Zinc finger CW-type PWWP domain protein 1 [Saguinus oedipus]
MEYNRCDIPEETWTGLESDVAYASYSKYHVTFFGETVSRAWIPVNMLKNFQELSLEPSGMKKHRNKDCSQKLGVALMMAQEAKQISIQERVNLFGFWSRFNGSNSNGERKDLQLSGFNSPGSCLEKKEEKEEELEKEEKKMDPTLPSCNQVKAQTKKTKPRGPKKKFKAPQSKALADSFSEGKEVRTVPKDLGPPAREGACPSAAKEEPRCRQPLTQKAGSVSLDDETSSDLDLEQLMEDVGRELGQSGELQHSDSDGEDFPVALFGK